MVRFINCFEVPDGREDDFMDVFAEVNAHMVAQPGYVGHRCTSRSPPTPSTASSTTSSGSPPTHWKAAHGPEFIAKVSRPEWAFFTSIPALYDIVDERTTS